jgi:putative ABC transport system ATP-binding protein
MPALIQLKGITRQFKVGDTTVEALRGIDLDIQSGEFAAIWGPSGSGKSSLLNLLGLIDQPSAGQLWFEGQDTAQLSDNALSDLRNQRIGFVFQNFNLVPVLSALDNVCLPLQIQGASSHDLRERAQECLRQVGLEKFSEFRPDRLSGGQRQRVAIARALVSRPALIIADEPTANLDSHTSREVIDLIENMNQTLGVTCIFTTHDPRLLERVPRQLRMQDGLLSLQHYQDSTATTTGAHP